MKKFITITVSLLSLTVFAQVGINNNSPKATLDITVKTTDGSKPEGLLAPRLTGDQIQAGDAQYTAAQKGLIIYATAATAFPSGKTANMTAEGYYFFDGNTWQKITDTAPGDATTTAKGIVQLAGDLSGTAASPSIANNAVTSAKILDATVANTDLATGVGGIYKGNGSLSGNTTVTQSANTLAFTSTATNGFSVDGTTLSVDAANNRVGIGTASPGNLLEISSSSNNTGLKLPYGAVAGKILTSDASGNSSWQSSNSVFIYSEIHGTGASQTFNPGNTVNFFHTIKGENVKTIYGNSYGWIDATQRWVAPYTGKYRVTTNMYYNPSSGGNPRVYAYVNGSTTCNITSASNDGATDGTAYTSAIVTLNQGDYVVWSIPTGFAAYKAALYGGDYHTFIRVESVE
ncbi:hypothetical protein [Chryseobacterium profundimaris]|uniref:C1q domain-containing protein n=1 Tax=Chryseobacterium profundimaris TaxID=1387275 RepID=A0ABY1NPD7_9FLAO|nr:hypothetical protein [Chryseobacterium profundimaris]SMP14856.1 hypothetical protein SAMN06264346_10394 [Chryseobacterium profundimaris]